MDSDEGLTPSISTTASLKLRSASTQVSNKDYKRECLCDYSEAVPFEAPLGA